jgi:PAS domain S-box-containing protein
MNILPGAICATQAYAIVTRDLDGVVTSWNAGATRLFGYNANEVIGTKIPNFVPPELEDEERQVYKRILQGELIDHYHSVRRHKDGRLVEVSLTISPVKDEAGRVIGVSKIARDISQSKRAQEENLLVFNELKHRLKNAYAIVQAIARQTLHGAKPEEFSAFSARLHALSHANELLQLHSWERTPLIEVVDRSLAAFNQAHPGRISSSGPSSVYLDANKALLLSLALHELATNAVKHGSLSTDSGRIDINWKLTEAARPTLRFNWRETGGPPVEAPVKHGFGMRLMERGLSAGLGNSHLEFKPEGLHCSIEIGI